MRKSRKKRRKNSRANDGSAFTTDSEYKARAHATVNGTKMRKDGTPVIFLNYNGNHYRNEYPEPVNTKEEEIAPDKTGQKLTTIGTGVQWDHFDKNDWQFFTRSVVEEQLRPPGLDRI